MENNKAENSEVSVTAGTKSDSLKQQNTVALTDPSADFRELDPLTACYSRETFFRMTSEMLMKHPDTSYVMVSCNINRFKVVNELLGTAAGDRILVAFGQDLQQYITDGTYGRLEADHFAVCVPASSFNPEEFVAHLDRLFDRMKLGHKIICYFGIYPIDDISLPVAIMSDRATIALGSVKGNYRQRYAYYDDKMKETLLREQKIVSEADTALRSGQFRIHLQPVFSVRQKNF